MVVVGGGVLKIKVAPLERRLFGEILHVGVLSASALSRSISP
jgi:hypothetical protein